MHDHDTPAPPDPRDGWADLRRRVDVDRLLRVLDGASLDDIEQALQRTDRDDRDVTPPPVDGDFYGLAETFTEDERRHQQLLRTFFARDVHPIIDGYWDRGEFPQEIVPKLAALVREMYGPYEPGMSLQRSGVVSLEMGRGDPSISTFFGVHWGLCMGSIQRFGSDEQKQRWLPAMYAFDKIGSWALTEPLHGSDASGGLDTTATRVGDTWTLDGDKKWSGNATIADVNVIWAKDTSDGQVKGFLVERNMPGYEVRKLHGKIGKRAVDNVDIALRGVKVDEFQRLPGARSFRDVSDQLAGGRTGVSWEAVGIAMAAYEHALDYCNRRKQFGKPITSFQLVQEQLVRMLGNVTAMFAMMNRLADIQRAGGVVSAERAGLAKAWCTTKMRETVAIARGVVGGNGILLEHRIARYFADAEAVYSYEGSYEMNTLIVGRAITGISAFV
jgi:glutaryl-CoA dehydrogenase